MTGTGKFFRQIWRFMQEAREDGGFVGQAYNWVSAKDAAGARRYAGIYKDFFTGEVGDFVARHPYVAGFSIVTGIMILQGWYGFSPGLLYETTENTRPDTTQA